MTTQLITAHFGEMSVLFQADGYINATAIAKQFGKQPRDYLKSRRTQEYIQSIKRILLLEQNQLVIVKNGGSSEEVGTWLHPKLAIDFARWLSAEFAVWCDLQIEKILQAKTVHLDLWTFLKTPCPEPITEADFEWRKHVIFDLVNGLKKMRVEKTTIVLGEELLNF